ncbi:ctr copper transporter family protein [Colletotrichum limetticola]|uniref:Ctr copper transporter family protein n=1 Tax=Colletotrichum limetticola TaxID=1209924 RepID=A0ABQ9PC11_9PEZI|nr:ctr copper transporter family protein [Colletotrichum limetticola]
MRPTYAGVLAALIATSFAAPTNISCTASKPVCKELVLPITAAANNTAFPAYPTSTEPGVLFEWLGSFNASTLPNAPVEGTFNISALYCEPTVKVKGREGYATLAIDNLGNGHSSRPDPVQIVQTPLQLAVVYEILISIRAGSLSGIPKYDKVIMGTHSYGSIIGRVLATIFPTSGADAYILTATAAELTGLNGFIADIAPRAATAVDPRFKGLAPGYLSATKDIRQVLYGPDGGFNPAVVAWDAASPHVFAAGEIAGSSSTQSSTFTGPVMIISGRQDQIACGSGSISDVPAVDCGVGPESHIEQTRSLFPNVEQFVAYVPDNTGHNVNTHYSAPESFGAAHAWLQGVGF